MDEIKFKLDDDGEPVCDVDNCPQAKVITGEVFSLCQCQITGVSFGFLGGVGMACVPGLRQQRDEARRERDEAQAAFCSVMYPYDDERWDNALKPPEMALEYGWDHLIEFQANSTGEVEKKIRANIKKLGYYDYFKRKMHHG